MSCSWLLSHLIDLCARATRGKLPKFQGATTKTMINLACDEQVRVRGRAGGTCAKAKVQAPALADRIVGEPTHQGRRDRARQQDRTDGLGDSGAGRALQGTRRAGGLSKIASDIRRDVRVGRGEQHVMQSRSI